MDDVQISHIRELHRDDAGHGAPIYKRGRIKIAGGMQPRPVVDAITRPLLFSFGEGASGVA